MCRPGSWPVRRFSSAPRRSITPIGPLREAEIPREVTRFEEALIQTRHQIHEIQQKVGEAIGQENASIFDAHLLVVDDRSFIEEVIRGLNAQRKNVEVVLRVVAERYAQALGGGR